MKFGLLSMLFFGLIFISQNTQAQCFASPGNPIAGNANLGVLDKGIVRAVAFHQYNTMDKYYTGSKPSSDTERGTVSSAFYNYSGISIGYGISKRFTIEAEAGYFIHKTQNHLIRINNSDVAIQEKGYGFSNAILSGKYNIYKNVVKGLEFSVAAGVKLPFSTQPQVVDGVELSIDVQPSTGNYGSVFQSFFVKEFDNISARLIMINRYENNYTENKQGYKFGDAYTNAVFLSKHLANQRTRLTKDITAILQLRHEYVKPYKVNNILADNRSGSSSFFVSPQLNYNLKMLWNFSIIFDIPVYQHYKGTQLAKDYALTITLTRDFGFKI